MIDFYKNMKPVTDFQFVANAQSYQPVPDDWWIFITDVVNSTEAIERGEYKEVNTAGAISLVALANEKLHLQVPVVFGGDGIMLLTPPESVQTLKDIFFGVRRFVSENFKLNLRIGLMPVSEIITEKQEILLGKFSSSNPFSQAIFAGDGIDAAEAKIKATGSRYLLPENYIPQKEASFAGFSCPFRDIPSANGVVLSLILKSRTDLAAYSRLIPQLLEILGPEKDFYPISWGNLHVGKTPTELRAWAAVAAGRNRGFKYWMTGIVLSVVMRMFSLLGKKLQHKAEAIMPLYTDHKKFDGTLKMVVRVTPATHEKIIAWLERHEATGDIYYGVHESQATLITCVFNGSADEKEIHLIDGSDGGYAMAAKKLKAKLSNK